MKNSILAYFGRVGDALSQLLNVTLLFGEDANQSVCGRAYVSQGHPVWKYIKISIDKVFSLFGVEDHCKRAYENDLSKASSYLRRHKDFK